MGGHRSRDRASARGQDRRPESGRGRYRGRGRAGQLPAVASETGRIAAFLRERLPGAAGPELYSKTCVYDMPPDRDFIIDHVPGQPRITIGIGAGHAAKFAGLLGKILADLATTGTTPYPVAAFRADRPALTDPRFEPVFRLAGPHTSG